MLASNQHFAMQLAPAQGTEEYLRITIVFLDEFDTATDLRVEAVLLHRDPANSQDSVDVKDLRLQTLDHPEVKMTRKFAKAVIAFALDAEWFFYDREHECD